MIGTRLKKFQAKRQVAKRLAAHPEAGALRLGSCLSLSPRRQVFDAQDDGTPFTVVRRIGPRSAQLVRNEAEATEAGAARLKDGPYRVTEMRLRDEAFGLVVAQALPGAGLMKAMSSGQVDRGEALSRAGAWLAAEAHGSRASDDFGGGFWIKEREQALTELSPGEDRTRLAQLIERMRQERQRIANRPVTRARSHGDYRPALVSFEGDAIWATGLCEGQWIAIMKDVARFLVDFSMRFLADGPVGPAGLSDADVSAFVLEPGLLIRGEVDALLPYFAAVELSGRLVQLPPDTGQAQRLRAQVDRTLSAPQS